MDTVSVWYLHYTQVTSFDVVSLAFESICKSSLRSCDAPVSFESHAVFLLRRNFPHHIRWNMESQDWKITWQGYENFHYIFFYSIFTWKSTPTSWLRCSENSNWINLRYSRVYQIQIVSVLWVFPPSFPVLLNISLATGGSCFAILSDFPRLMTFNKIKWKCCSLYTMSYIFIFQFHLLIVSVWKRNQ